MKQQVIFDEIRKERNKQKVRYNEVYHTSYEWISIIMYYFAQLINAIAVGNTIRIKRKLIVCAALFVAWLEQND